MNKILKCTKCGSKLKINEKIVLLKYILFGSKHQYVSCNNCLTINSLFIYHNIVKDNDDELLRIKNQHRNIFKE